ncbi:hypothetical protein, conserved in T. vivax [Trypanosoma vivax Y486]|uniref:Uncharacterized protein n=1 Tax=Trypanosoma vivax (strain Y486) TaxID=1055687 RepID=F9WSD5_TRYVY|nr:hypothetical protein, conserved in T. vivax [Trypanosoma vivax Y486]|eukprot:CCD20474.1 hypothetical protein, conserved in T. vivax [Trypanosoma vivax Y486]
MLVLARSGALRAVLPAPPCLPLLLPSGLRRPFLRCFPLLDWRRAPLLLLCCTARLPVRVPLASHLFACAFCCRGGPFACCHVSLLFLFPLAGSCAGVYLPCVSCVSALLFRAEPVLFDCGDCVVVACHVVAQSLQSAECVRGGEQVIDELDALPSVSCGCLIEAGAGVRAAACVAVAGLTRHNLPQAHLLLAVTLGLAAWLHGVHDCVGSMLELSCQVGHSPQRPRVCCAVFADVLADEPVAGDQVLAGAHVGTARCFQHAPHLVFGICVCPSTGGHGCGAAWARGAAARAAALRAATCAVVAQQDHRQDEPRLVAFRVKSSVCGRRAAQHRE